MHPAISVEEDRAVSGMIYIQTTREAEGSSSWNICTVIRAWRVVFRGHLAPKPRYERGIVVLTHDRVARPVAVICSKAPWKIKLCEEPLSNRERQWRQHVAETML